jgi:hypothetical protein
MAAPEVLRFSHVLYTWGWTDRKIDLPFWLRILSEPPPPASERALMYQHRGLSVDRMQIVNQIEGKGYGFGSTSIGRNTRYLLM